MKRREIATLSIFLIGFGILLWRNYPLFAFDCRLLRSDPVFTLQEGHVTQADIKAWILEKYGVTYRTENVFQAGAEYEWRHSRIRYFADFKEGQFQQAILTFDDDISPTGNDILHCLGTPSSYQARFMKFPAFGSTAQGSDLILWYDDLWMEIEASHTFNLTEEPPEPVQPTDRFPYMIISAPGYYQVDLPIWKQDRQPWESWNAIETKWREQIP